jgi:ADP-L-glycero-D-manno-heptose 6-epimerase
MKEVLPSGLIVVTGAAGLIGSQLVNALHEKGCKLVGVDFHSHSERAAYFEGIDFRAWLHPTELGIWLDANASEVSAILHMGAISDTTETDEALLEANNVRYTLDLWEKSREHNWRFLYASSAATYGDGSNGFVDSDDLDDLAKLQPLNLYGWSKHKTDVAILEMIAHGEKAPDTWAGFKFFNVYGPNEEHKGSMRSLVRKIAPQIQRGEVVRLFKSHRPDYEHGAQERDFIYVKDAIAPVILALGRERLSGLFNVGVGHARSFRDLALATYAAFDSPEKIEYVDMPENIRIQYQYHTAADTEKTRAHRLYVNNYSLEQGVADYVGTLIAKNGETDLLTP